VASDTAAKAVMLLNAQQDGNLRADYVMPASTSEFLSCHGPEKEVGAKKDISSFFLAIYRGPTPNSLKNYLFLLCIKSCSSWRKVGIWG